MPTMRTLAVVLCSRVPLATLMVLVASCAHTDDCEVREYTCPGVLSYAVHGAHDAARTVESFEVRMCGPGQCSYVSAGEQRLEPIDCDVAARFVERARAFGDSVPATNMESPDPDTFYRLTIVTPDGVVRRVSRSGTSIEPRMLAIVDALARNELFSASASGSE